VSTAPFLPALTRALRDGAPGALEWRDDRRRRLFFLAEGHLLAAQSNLRSETTDRLRELDPSLDGPALTRAEAVARLRGALAEPAGEVTWHPGQRPSEARPLPVGEVLRACSTSLPAVPDAAWPRLLPHAGAHIHALGFPETLRDWLSALDGTRPHGEVVAFGPDATPQLDGALRVAILLGAVDANVQAARAVHDAPASLDDLFADPLPAPPAPAAAPSGEALRRGGPPPPQEEPAHAPAPSGNADLEAVVARISRAAHHFEVLDVAQDAAPEAMRRAYFTLARMLHPDQLHDVDEATRARATDAFDKVRAAWEDLGDDAKRNAYVARVIRGEKSEDELATERVKAILEAEGEFSRGLIALHAGRIPEAHAAFQRVVAVVDDSPEFNAYAAWTAFKLAPKGDGQDAAFNRIRAAVRANDKLDAPLTLLGMAYKARGQDDLARAAFIQALKLKPSNPDAARELRRMEREAATKQASGGFFSRLFGKK
jgi:tetratricopeptide (TPR) repeat protein